LSEANYGVYRGQATRFEALRHGKDAIETARRLHRERGLSASLEKRKICVALADRSAEKDGLDRVVDESGDDYLYPKSFVRALAQPALVTCSG
jgi:hypothetical protein